MHPGFSRLSRLTIGVMATMITASVVTTIPSSATGATAPTLLAPPSPQNIAEAGWRMHALSLIKGKAVGEGLALNDEMSRAELVTVIVRAFGRGLDAPLLNGAPAFPDTATHWASGNIAMAKTLVEKAGGESLGMPDGRFAPDRKLTAAEAVAFLMKFLGVKPDPTLSWPANYLDVAAAKGLISQDERGAINAFRDTPATRGLVFFMLDRAFYSYDVGAGKTVYTTYVDSVAPVLELDQSVPAKTTLSSITVIGQVSNGAVSVKVDGQSVTLFQGHFEAEVALVVGETKSVVVAAFDLAGNRAEKSIVVTREPAIPTQMEVPGAVTIEAGETAALPVIVKDQLGHAITDDVVKMTGDGGTWAGGQLTSSTHAGQYTMQVKAGSLSQTVTLTVTPGTLDHIAVIGPSPVYVKEENQFTVEGRDKVENPIQIVGPVIWSTDFGGAADGGTLVPEKPGTYVVRATYKDYTAEATVAAVNRNRPPAFTSAWANKSQTISEGSTLAPLAATDPDGDTLTYKLVGGTLPAGITLREDGSFAGWVPYGYPGTYAPQVEVSDGKGGTARTTIAVTVYHVNRAPVFTSAETNYNQTLAKEVQPTALQAYDLDGDTLTFSLVDGILPLGLTLYSNGTFEHLDWVPGISLVTIQVSDGRGGVATTNIEFYVPDLPAVLD